MQVVRAASYRRMPWKNGGGETIEMLASPAGVSLETFDWRISMASVVADGPFSSFAGIDRTLGIIDGAGLVLSRIGEPDVEITSGTMPFSFPGDIGVECRLVSGGIRDLNVMTRRDRWRNRVTRYDLTSPAQISCKGEVVVAICVGHCAELKSRDQTVTLNDTDALVLEKTDERSFLVPSRTKKTALFVVELSHV